VELAVGYGAELETPSEDEAPPDTLDTPVLRRPRLLDTEDGPVDSGTELDFVLEE
jgi:hypothetical protein